MNKRQEKALESIKNMLINRYNRNIIEIDITEYDFCNELGIQITAHPKGINSDLFNNCYSFFIGAKGGIYRFNSKYNREYIADHEIFSKCDIWN